MPRIPRRDGHDDEPREQHDEGRHDDTAVTHDSAPVDERAHAGEAPAGAKRAGNIQDLLAGRDAEDQGRVSVVNEPHGDPDDEYRWHTGKQRPHGSTDAVEFIDTHKAFGRNKILRGLNMGLPEGKISMILGPSGTGKSVCIKHMVGLLYPDDGDVLVHGESVPNMQDDELFEMRKKFGVLFQDGALFGSMNVFDNTAFPLRQHTDKGEDEINDIVSRRLEEVGLGPAGDKMPNELSGRHAQARRVRAGARARSGHRPLRRAGLRPGPGAHRPAGRAHPGDPRGDDERPRGHRAPFARVHPDHARHHDRAPRRRAHLRALEGTHRRVRSGRGALRVRQPVRAPVPLGRVAGPARDGIALRISP
jgi:predicted ABC-type transport system involved in lysophospholipase L1 biosynthesis ATPase subunit